MVSAQDPILETRGLTKVFKDFWMRPRVTAVDQLDLAVYPHEVFGLLGPNGSGKSTTIKILLGLLFPTRGRVGIFGKLPSDVATKKRIGYLPEESYLYRFLNARETLDYYARLFHFDRPTRNKRIDMLLEMVGLEAVQHRPIGEFSKGMQRRIGLAQALINDPDLLILDEPTTGLDPLGTRQIKDLILHLKERGKTVVLSSHLLADVEDVCGRACILYGGRKRAEGTVDELLTVEGTSLIETDALNEQTISKIEQLIQSEEGKAIRRVEAPRQKLENLFLDIVEKARTEGAKTSGAGSGAGVADFLTDPSQDAEGDALIDHLVTGDQHDTAQQPDDTAQPAAAQPDEEGPATEVLDQLTTGATPEQQPTHETGTQRETAAQPDDQPAEPQQPAEDENTDREVIDELLGDHDRTDR